jgi:hypothetical protein
MNDWKRKLDLFLTDFEYADDVVGVLVCGSYITGNPTSHSVLILTASNSNQRLRGDGV